MTLYDPSPASIEAALEVARTSAVVLANQDLLHRQADDQVLVRLKPARDLAEAVARADHIQEGAPGRLAVEQALYRDLGRLAPAGAVIASSTWGLPASSFTAITDGRERCLVAQPINPPHLIPLVEVVPAPWTDSAVVERTDALMRRVGQVPIRLPREIPASWSTGCRAPCCPRRSAWSRTGCVPSPTGTPPRPVGSVCAGSSWGRPRPST